MDKNKNNYHISWIGNSPSVGSEQINYYAVKKGTTTLATFVYDRDYDHPGLSQEQALEDAKWYLAQKCDSETEYNPCRKFKKGDLVKKRYIYGRSCDAIGSLGIYTVTEDEDTNRGNVLVKNDTGRHCKVKAVFLQLVTAVEDRPVYSIQENEDQSPFATIGRFDIMRDKLCVMSFPFGAKEHGCYYNKTAAKEAAEIECNRLNNLYKQELENNG